MYHADPGVSRTWRSVAWAYLIAILVESQRASCAGWSLEVSLHVRGPRKFLRVSIPKAPAKSGPLDEVNATLFNTPEGNILGCFLNRSRGDQTGRAPHMPPPLALGACALPAQTEKAACQASTRRESKHQGPCFTRPSPAQRKPNWRGLFFVCLGAMFALLESTGFRKPEAAHPNGEDLGDWQPRRASGPSPKSLRALLAGRGKASIKPPRTTPDQGGITRGARSTWLVFDPADEASAAEKAPAGRVPIPVLRAAVAPYPALFLHGEVHNNSPLERGLLPPAPPASQRPRGSHQGAQHPLFPDRLCLCFGRGCRIVFVVKVLRSFDVFTTRPSGCVCRLA